MGATHQDAQIQSSLLYNRLWTSGDIVAVPKYPNGQPSTVSCWVNGVGTAWDINSQAQTSLSTMLINNAFTNILQHTMRLQACINIWCIHKHVSTMHPQTCVNIQVLAQVWVDKSCLSRAKIGWFAYSACSECVDLLQSGLKNHLCRFHHSYFRAILFTSFQHFYLRWGSITWLVSFPVSFQRLFRKLYSVQR